MPHALAAARLPALLTALALAGCASLSEHQCRSGDWEAIGREDGARGAAPAELEQHRQACAQHGVEPRAEAWRAGYVSGLATFCTPEGGYVAGRSASGHHQVCAGKPEESAFLAAYRHGEEVNALIREARDTYRRLRNLESSLAPGAYSERANVLADTLRRRLWELERLDRRYSLDYGVPELDDEELYR